MASPSPGGLPSEYQAVEWIGAERAPAIDSGISATLDTVVKCSLKRTNNSGNYPAFFGQNSPIFAITYSNQSNYCSVGNKSDQLASVNLTDAFHEIELSKDAILVDGVSKKTIGATSLTPNDSRHIFLFARCSQNNTVERVSDTQMQWFKIYKNGTLVCDLVPCYRKSDNVVGMYDLVQRVFRTNIGTGSFTKGGNV